MGEINSIQQNIAQDLSKLNDIIKNVLECNSALMNQIVTNFLESKGKQIRPILVILSGRFFGGTNERNHSHQKRRNCP